MPTWQKTILLLILLTVVLDDLALFWWRRIHPNAEWNGAFGKNPLTLYEGVTDDGDWNGLRPGGGNTRGTAW
jgi:hypothetical protein